MSKISLDQFASKAFGTKRISFADVQRLQRDILPDGIGSREEAELLIGLDRDVGRADDTWERWLLSMIVDFVVWAERPTGVVDEDTARWLAATLAPHANARATKTARLIAREIALEAQGFENDALTALAVSFPKARFRQADPAFAPVPLAP